MIYYEQHNVGASRYVVNYHDGEKTNSDGSPFFDIAIFRNRKKKDAFVADLRKRGYRDTH